MLTRTYTRGHQKGLKRIEEFHSNIRDQPRAKLRVENGPGARNRKLRTCTYVSDGIIAFYLALFLLLGATGLISHKVQPVP